MRFLVVVLLSVFMLGCSSKPSSTDVEKALSKQLVTQCEFATVDGLNLGEVIQPDSNNSNSVIVKYSYELGVRVGGGYVDNFRRWEKLLKFRNQIREAYDQPGESKALLDKWIRRERLSPDASNEEYETEDAETRRLEHLVKVERYKRIKELVDSTDGMFSLSDDYGPPPDFKLIENVKEPEFPGGCIDYSQSTPLGLLYSTVRRQGSLDATNQYINGVSVNIEAESVMLKTDAGWTFR
jgi:uncharacterized protein YktA (UPF0223 family)